MMTRSVALRGKPSKTQRRQLETRAAAQRLERCCVACVWRVDICSCNGESGDHDREDGDL
jgi:hypothetical protein